MHTPKITFLTILTIIGLILIGGSIITLYSQSVNESNSEDTFNLLSLNVTTDKTDFFLFEPIPLTIKLENKTSNPVVGNISTNFDRKYIKLVVTNQNGVKKEISQLSAVSCKCEDAKNTIVPPGKIYVKQETLFNLHQAFYEKGEYQIQLVFQDVKRQNFIKSNVFSINITEPTGEDLTALNSIREEVKASPFFFSGLGEEKTYDSLANSYPSTLYGSYASYFVGLKYFYKHDYSKAKVYLKKALENESLVFTEEITSLNKDSDLQIDKSKTKP